MAKMKVHELAKEIDKTSKEIMGFLTEKGIEVKSHMSNLEDDQINLVKKALASKKAEAPKAETSKTETPKTEAPKAEAVKAEAPVKKKKPNIIFVNNPYNSRNNDKNGRPSGPNRGRQVGQIGGEPEKPAAKIETPKEDTPKMETPKAEVPVVEAPKTEAPKVEEVKTEAPKTEAPKTESAPAAPAQSAPANNRPSTNSALRPQGSRPPGSYNNNRPQGQGGYNNNRPQGQGGYNNNNGNRPQGQGGYNNNRPQGQGGYNNNNGNRPQGQGGYNNNTGNRPQGQGGYNNNRPQGQGGYNNNRPQGQGGYNNNRPQGQGGYNNNRPQGQGGYNNNRPQGQGGYNNNRPAGGYNNNGGRTYAGNSQGQGGYNNNRSGGQGGYNNYRGGDNRSQGARGTDSKGFGVETPIKEQEKHRGEQDRRRQSLEKHRKESIYDRGEDLKPKKFNPHGFIKPEKVETPPEEKIKVITLPETLTIKELAEKMKMQPSVIVKKLFLQGTVVTVNQEISYEQAEEIAIEYDIICEQEVKVDVIEELLKEEEEDTSLMVKRPPVICVMGHVDHGKTSLLDAIRKTNVTDREAGGITQAIGAYTVNIKNEKITFLDTPGHEAFTAMRMRGANSTDIAILVVAADDGVMPQTVEAINHAKAAGIEIIVAVNKMDKPNANIERVKQELAEYELISEDWGGSTVFVPVSAKSGEGIEQLLEMILLTSELLELKANPKRQARGLVIEAELDKGRGPVATVLVQKGTLHVGDFVAAGACHGKVRAMIDDKGKRVKEAGPSTPVEILGLNDVPNAGEIFVAPENDKEARTFAETFISQNKVKLLDDTKQKMSLDDLFSQIKEGDLKELGLIIKADVQGSVEAIKQSMVKLSNEEVVVKIIHGGVGAINESDVILASASNAIIIGFNVRPDATAKATAESEGVDVRLYKVIYQAIEDVEAAMKGMLDPVFEEKIIGHAEIRQIFKASDIGNISGSYVLDGVFERGCSVRITREGEQVFEGSLASLKRFKDDVKEVKAGFECGLVFEGFDAVQEFDQIEAYKMVQVEVK